MKKKTLNFTPLREKEILLGVSGGIAAYKAADYLRRIMTLGAKVQVVMTKAATQFVSPLTFEALSGQPVYFKMFGSAIANPMAHIELARKADLCLVLPATANILAKAAAGMADELLLAILLCHERPALFFPSMNPSMFSNPATQANLKTLKKLGHQIVEPESGSTACGEVGKGRLPEWFIVREAILAQLSPKDLKGLKILVVSGPTREPLDPVRFISNRSSGKMGRAMALEAQRRGGDVTLVTGPTSLKLPSNMKVISVETASQMSETVKKLAADSDSIVMAAAVSDYTPKQISASKIKKHTGSLVLELIPTEDILSSILKQRRPGQIIIGFSAETENLIENSLKKIRKKPVDLLVANNVSIPGAGFDVETNKVVLITKEEERIELPMLHKEEVAQRIWDYISHSFIDT